MAIVEVEGHHRIAHRRQTELILSPHVSLYVNVCDNHIVSGASKQFPHVLHIFEEVGLRCVHRGVLEGHVKVEGRPHYIYLISDHLL